MLVLALALPMPSVAQAQGRSEEMQPRVIVGKFAEQPVRIVSARIDARVTGSFAVTTLELSLHNPNRRILEGSVEFPLREGQQVIGMASEVDGQLREAVAVEKAKGRMVFEDVERARIDPALLEQTAGNNYRLRVYPIRPQGETRLAIRVLENLQPTKNGLLFRMPLGFASGLKQLSLSIKVDDPGRAPTLSSRGLGTIALRGAGRFYEVTVDRSSIGKEAEVSVEIPGTSAARVYLGEHDGQKSFYAELPIEAAPKSRPVPKRLAILWDASMSGANRKLDDELALLKRYLAAIGNVEVTLHVLRNVLEAARPFTVRNGESSALRDALRQIVYDGATNFSAIPKTLPADAALLFSDGLSNFGAGAMGVPDVPLSVVSSALQADTGRLRHLARLTGGSFVDLSTGLDDQSLKTLMTIAPSIARLDGEGVADLVARPVGPGDRRIAIAGRIIGAAPQVSIALRGVRSASFRLRPEALARAPVSPLAPWRWAQLRIDELAAERDQHRAEILRLSKAYSVVSPETSLIVLERVADYARHRIQPPDELRGWYEIEITKLEMNEQKRRADATEHLFAAWKSRRQWWETDFPKEKRVPPAKPQAEIGERGAAELALMEQREQSERSRPPAMALAPAPLAAAPAAPPPPERGSGTEPGTPGIGVRLKKWTSNAPYIARMAEASPDRLYAVYLDARADNANSSAFFLDAADVLFDKGQADLGLRVLSNLAEMQLENRDLLRLLATRLLRAGQPALAVPVLKLVLEIAPDEPHSLRDLAQAQAAAGDPAEAVRLLNRLVQQDWPERFGDIAEISLAEMNALLAVNPQLDRAAIDPRLIDNLPVALRVVLSWDNDNTDIDLFVKDPNGEIVNYRNKQSHQGGRISRDVTSSYGPEEFVLKVPMPGTYEIHANFYGHRQQVLTSATTVLAEITTDFGTPAAVTQRATLRLRERKDDALVAEIVVK